MAGGIMTTGISFAEENLKEKIEETLMQMDIHPNYPSQSEIDAWIDDIWKSMWGIAADAKPIEGKGITYQYGVRHPDNLLLRFSAEGLEDYYGYWQPAPSGPAPLLVHVPGYGTEMSVHPSIQAAGFNILHVNPLGYCTPNGTAEEKKRDGNWPVLPDTILTSGKSGYVPWLSCVVAAINWAQQQETVLKDRLSFFGTSQGGGCSLLLGSLYRGRGARCVAADVPFLTGIFMHQDSEGAYKLAIDAIKACSDKPKAWWSAGLVDTMAHAHRLDLPVLLTAGSADITCTSKSIEALFHLLPGTKSYNLFKDVGHRYTSQFPMLANAWFRLHG